MRAPFWFDPWLTVTVVVWGFNFVALKFVYEQMTPAALGLVRFLALWVVLLGICAIGRHSLRFPRGEAFRILIQGFLSLGLYMVLFLEGMVLVDPAQGAIILSTSPIFTAIVAAVVRQERWSPATLLGTILAFGGVTLVIGIDALAGRSNPIGVALLVGSALVWACATVISRPIVATMAPVRMLTLSMPGALPILLLYGWRDVLAINWSTLTPNTWANLFHIAFLAGLVGFVGFYFGVRKVGASAAMLYQFFVPICAALFAWWALGTTLTLLQWAGIGVVIAGVSHASLVRVRLAQRGELAVND